MSAVDLQDSTDRTALEAAADALLEAHAWAEQDGDNVLRDLVSAALLYAGTRLAMERKALGVGSKASLTD